MLKQRRKKGAATAKPRSDGNVFDKARAAIDGHRARPKAARPEAPELSYTAMVIRERERELNIRIDHAAQPGGKVVAKWPI